MDTNGQIQLKGSTSMPKDFTIDLPSCWKSGTTCVDYVAVLNEHTAISIFKSGDLIMITHSTPERLSDRIITASEKWEMIPDGNFLEEYEAVMNSLSLRPQAA
jgi:hypothetical protein